MTAAGVGVGISFVARGSFEYAIRTADHYARRHLYRVRMRQLEPRRWLVEVVGSALG